jgi:hypothetical protein
MDRRREPRFDCQLPVCVTPLAGNSASLKGILTNISPQGARIAVSAPLDLNVPVRVDTGDVFLLGDVCYCHPEPGGYSVGVVLAHSVGANGSLSAFLTALMSSSGEQAWEIPKVRAVSRG